MGRESERGRTFWHGVVHSLAWLARVVLIALALYIFFPPFWDAIFVANLKALHDAPYIAADRARRLWHLITGELHEAAGERGNGGAAHKSGARL